MTLKDAEHEARAIVRGVIAEYEPVAVCGLFSGGNDSTVLVDVVKDYLTHIVHVNTTIGIEETRTYVRHMANDYWKIPYIEATPPVSYRDIVLGKSKGYGGGFPGPGAHSWMYRRLKERALREVRRGFIGDRGRSERVMFIGGTRISESERRFRNITRAVDREGAVVWVAPMVWWTNENIVDYRKQNPDLPRNPASEHLHMSGECLCGSFARKNELSEIEFFFPETAKVIHDLEDEMHALVRSGEIDVDHKKMIWGWGSSERLLADEEEVGRLCSSCTFRSGEEE